MYFNSSSCILTSLTVKDQASITEVDLEFLGASQQ